MTYYVPTGGLPGQEQLTTDRAVFTDAYAVLPRGTMRDIVTSQLPVDRWYEIIGNPTIADAILDRLVDNAYRIELKGESLRKQKQTAQDQPVS